MSYQVILFTDTPSTEWFSRSYGTYRLATELRNHGYTVLTVDFTSSLTWDNYQKLIDKVVDENTLVVGFSTTWFPYRNSKVPNARYSVGFKSTGKNEKIDFDHDMHKWYYDSLSHCFSQESTEKWIEYVKNKNSKTKVIIGGAKAHEYAVNTHADNIFIGFCENMLVDYLDSMTKKGPKRLFNHVIDYDLRAMDPRFDFTTSRTEYVDTDIIYKGELMTFEFSRGCIFNCTFCSYPHKNQKVRNYIKTKETLIKEFMDNYEKWGVTNYLIVDDTFNDSVEKLEFIKEVIQTLPFKPKFWAYARLDLVASHPEMAQLMKDIGVCEVYYGIETWHDETAKIINKGGKLQRKIDGMRIAKECWGDDVYVMVGLIIGLPRDTVQSVYDCCEWMKNEGHKYVDWFATYSYTISPPDEVSKYRMQSDIEKNLDKWGYTFPDTENTPWEWIRSGPGDITTKEQANALMHESFKLLEPYNKPRNLYWFQGAWSAIDPVYDFDKLRVMSIEERGKYFTVNTTDMYYKYVTEHYWNKLFNLLGIE